MTFAFGAAERRVLILAPTGKDAPLTRDILGRAGIDAHICSDIADLRTTMEAGAAAILLAEEALWGRGGEQIISALASQPAWSDLPVLVLARHGADSPTIVRALELLGNVAILERPTRIASLVSAVRAALRARSRQYQLRAQIREQEKAGALLEQSSESLRLAMDAGAMGAYDTDLRNGSAIWTEASFDILGYPRRPDLSASFDMWLDGIVPEDVDQVMTEYERAKREGTRYALEFRFLRPSDQRRIWISSLGRFTYDREGQAVRSIGVFYDSTSRKEIEQQQRDLNTRLSEIVEERTAQLRDLSQHLLEVSETEKTNLARELHDELGSLLTAISMDLAGVKRQVAAREPALAEQLEQTIALVQSTTQIKRRIMEGLHPSSLDSMGLAEALRTLCEDFSTRSGIYCQTTATADFSKLDESMSIALYRIVQEALTNVAKHASANRVTVSLSEDEDGVRLEIVDDGAGFDTEFVAGRRTHGLSGMRERVAYFNGSFGLSSSATGTRIHVCIPQRQPADREPVAELSRAAEPHGAAG